MALIPPTVGRIVYYQRKDRRLPVLAAIIAYVHSEKLINIAGFNEHGEGFSQTSVPLVQDTETPPEGAFAHWMPYQIGQAKASAEKQLSSQISTERAQAQVDVAKKLEALATAQAQAKETIEQKIAPTKPTPIFRPAESVKKP